MKNKDLIINNKIDLEALEGIVYEEKTTKKDSVFIMTPNGVQEKDSCNTSYVYKVKQEHLKDMFGDDFVCDADEVSTTCYKDIPELKEEVWELIFNKEKGE